MGKVAVGADNFLYPMPMVLVGANVGGKPNFLAVAFFSRYSDEAASFGGFPE